MCRWKSILILVGKIYKNINILKIVTSSSPQRIPSPANPGMHSQNPFGLRYAFSEHSINVDVFYLNTINHMPHFVEQLDQLKVCLPCCRLLSGIHFAELNFILFYLCIELLLWNSMFYFFHCSRQPVEHSYLNPSQYYNSSKIIRVLHKLNLQALDFAHFERWTFWSTFKSKNIFSNL